MEDFDMMDTLWDGEPVDVNYDELERDHDEQYDPDDYNDESDVDDMMDSDFDSAMTSAGFGTDESYGYYGDE